MNVSDLYIMNSIRSSNHVIIGIYYMFFGFIGGSLGWGLSIIMRLELGLPGFIICSSFTYNSCISFHGIIMIFFMIMPLLIGGFGNLLIPFIIGSSDMVFPRLNGLSMWMVIDAVLLVFMSTLVDGGVNCGWTFYVPLSFINYYSIDALFFSLHIVGISSIIGSVNFICTIMIIYCVNFKLVESSVHLVALNSCIGYFRYNSSLNLPLFIWSLVITSILLILSVPVLAACITMVIFDRYFNCCFFDVLRGGDVLLFQHLFWFFGHPEVYILILPGFGLISEIIAKFSQCIVFSSDSMLLSLWIIGILGCVVWGHHMYIVGFDIDTRTYFTSSTSIIAIPTSIKILNWLSTWWSGGMYCNVSILAIIGFLVCFSFGGLTGLILSSAIIDSIIHDGYFIVAHFHYVLSLGAVFIILGGIALYWVFFVRETLCIVMENVYWILFLASNTIFLPLHYYGLIGGSRRYIEYEIIYIGYFYSSNLVIGGMLVMVALLVIGT